MTNTSFILRVWTLSFFPVALMAAIATEPDVPGITLGKRSTVEVLHATVEAVARHGHLDELKNNHMARAVRPHDVKYLKISEFETGDFPLSAPAATRSALRAYSYGFDLWDAAEMTSAPKDSSIVLRFEIVSPESRSVVLGLGSSDQYVLWHNGAVKFAIAGRRDRVRKAQDLVTLELTAGANAITLLYQREKAWSEIPSNHFDGRLEWSGAVTVFTDAKEAWEYHTTTILHPFETPIVDELAGLQMEGYMESISDTALYDLSGNLLMRGRARPSGRIDWQAVPDLKLPRPFLGFVIIGDTVGEVILVKQGLSEEEACKSLVAQIDPNTPTEWMFRLQHYLKPEFITTCDPWGWRRINEAFVMNSAAVQTPAVTGLMHKCRALGVKIGRYQSKFDGTNQYYLSYESDPGGPLRPLVVILPPVYATFRGFLLSPTIEHIQGVEAYVTIARQTGVDLLWAGFSNVDYGGRMYLQDTAECLEHYAAGRPRESIFGFGICAAGFAAQSVVDAGLGDGGVLLHNPVVFRRKAKWLAQLPLFDTGYPASVLEAENATLVNGRFRDLPVRIVWDALEEGHGDMRGVLDFQQELRATGKDIKAYWEKRSFQTQPWGQRLQESSRILWRWAQESFAKAHPIGAPPAAPAAPVTKTIKDRLLQTFHVVKGDDALLNRWAEEWLGRMAIYRGEAPVLTTANRTRVTLATLNADTIVADYHNEKFQGAPQNHAQNFADRLAGRPFFGFRDLTSSEQAPDVQVFRGGPDAELAPMDLLLDGICRGAIWIQQDGEWKLLEVWL